MFVSFYCRRHIQPVESYKKTLTVAKPTADNDELVGIYKVESFILLHHNLYARPVCTTCLTDSIKIILQLQAHTVHAQTQLTT